MSKILVIGATGFIVDILCINVEDDAKQSIINPNEEI